MSQDGFKIGYISLVLNNKDSQKKRKFSRLCDDINFVSNWSFFPMEFMRSVRQKTRWITGIVLQEIVFSGWKGNIRIKEALIKDRKSIINVFVALLGYILILIHLALWGMDIELSAYSLHF